MVSFMVSWVGLSRRRLHGFRLGPGLWLTEGETRFRSRDHQWNTVKGWLRLIGLWGCSPSQVTDAIITKQFEIYQRGGIISFGNRKRRHPSFGHEMIKSFSMLW